LTALLFKPSATPLENSFSALKYLRKSSRCARSVRAILFI